MDRYSGTLLPQSSDKMENQKAILDLLSKINGLYNEYQQVVATQNLVLNHARAVENPVDGQMWYDDVSNSIINRIDGVNLFGSGVLFSGVGTTIGNTTTELSQIGAGVGTTLLPADFLSVGKLLRIKVRGRITTAAVAPSTTFTLKLDGFTLVTSTGTLPINLSNAYVESELDIRCSSIGSNGALWVSGRNLIQTSTGLAAPYLRGLSTASLTTVNTKIPLQIDLTYKWAVAAVANTLTIDLITIEVLA